MTRKPKAEPERWDGSAWLARMRQRVAIIRRSRPSLAEARAVLRRAEETDPEALRRLEEYEVVKNIDFRQEIRGLAQPGFGALTPLQREEAERKLRAAQEAQKRELAARERRAESLERDLKMLEAGQTADNRRLVRSTVNQG